MTKKKMAITLVVLAVALVLLLFLGDEDDWGGGEGEPALVRIPVENENRPPLSHQRKVLFARLNQTIAAVVALIDNVDFPSLLVAEHVEIVVH